MGFNQTYGTPQVYWYLDDADFLELGKDAETWIYPSKTFSDVYAEKKELLDQFKSVQERNVYDNQGQGSFGWHEQRPAEYDVVALDMCTLVGTNNPESIHRRRWFRNYFDEPIGSPGTCNIPDEIEEAYIPAQAACTPLTADSSVTGSIPAEDATPSVASENAASGTHGVKLIIVTAVAGIVSAVLA